MEKLKKDFYNYRYLIIILSIYIIFMQVVFKSLCPVKAIFHVDCPGCGLTHASFYLITGRFKDAIDANYTVFLWWGLAILFVIDRYFHKFNKNVLPVSLIIVSVVTIFRYISIII